MKMALRQNGWALLVILATLAVLSVVTLAFLATTRTELAMSTAYSRSNESRMLVESVTNLVIGQMREATSQTNTAWITQPGLIRTFTSSGTAGPAYKLYSSDTMVVSSGLDPEAALATEVPSDWSTKPDDFFDLNRPVSKDGQWRYPILDPAAEGIIAGFENQADDKGITTGLNAPYPAMPMPVRWIYLLKNGSLAARAADGTIPGASKDNPPEARVAFWADDETCKINLNTASSGLFWDVPRGRGNDFEKGAFGSNSATPTVAISGLASSPPGVREFNRYPGHPATTSLDVVLNNNYFFPGITDPMERKKEILRYAPRIAFGGSELGTKFPLSSTPVTLDNDRLYASVDEYLYANDRTMNKAANSQDDGITPQKLNLARFFLTTSSRSPETTLHNTPRVTIWPTPRDPDDRTPFEKTIAFCSTVGGEEFLFDRGKFEDGALAFSPTVNSGGVIWVNFNGANSIPALNQSTDFTAKNAKVYDYLIGLSDKNIPGFGSSLDDKFEADTGQIFTEVFDYIRATNLYDLSAPNSQPYTARPIIHGEIASATMTLRDIGRPSWTEILTADYLGSAYLGQVTPIRIQRNSQSTRGLGRFPVITGATIVVMATEPEDIDKKFSGTVAYTRDPSTYADFTNRNLGSTLAVARAATTPSFGSAEALPARQVQAFVIFSLATPSAGPLAHNFTYDLEVGGLQGMTINGENAGFPAIAKNSVIPNDGSFKGTPIWTDGFTAARTFPGSLAATDYQSLRKIATAPATGNNWFAYPFAGTPVNIDDPTVTIGTTVMDVALQVDGQTLQTYRIRFPSFTAPAPLWTNLRISPGSNNYYMDTLTDRMALPPDDQNFQPFVGDPNGGAVIVPALVLPYDVDVVRSVELVHGDARIVAGMSSSSIPDVPESMYRPSDGYTNPGQFQAQNLRLHPKGSWGELVPSNSPVVSNTNILGELALPSLLTEAERSDGQPGDWDMGLPEINYSNQGRTEAGAFINKPDDCAMFFRGNNATLAAASVPYFQAFEALAIEENAFTPNRILPSPVMFGSLPVGVKRNLPWQTPLFRPDYPTHPGADNPPDHLLLDLFTMPVVEPYPISEPFSTDGKVNLNCQIAPFTYIKRNTGLRAVLDSVRLFANSTDNPYLNALSANGTTFQYPTGTNTNAASRTNYRYPIDADATVKLFEERFRQNKPFLTASSLCEMFLVPKPETKAASGVFPATQTPFQTALAADASPAAVESYVKNFWDTAGNATADNLRERPYAMIYPRVTARSNTFTVHMCVQSLKKSPQSPSATFDSAAGDKVTGEYRGSVTIERFLDPNNANFDMNDANSQLGPYLFRTTNAREFNP